MLAQKNIYFLGIGGIGMSALARYFKSAGRKVSGYDKTPSPLTSELQKEGIEVGFEDDEAQLNRIKNTYIKQDTLVIYTPAVPTNSILLNGLRDAEYNLIKRARALGDVTKETINLSIAGTHGKTTTSCLLSHLLDVGKIPAVSILGGISANHGSNYYNTLLPNKPRLSVTEADEFDRSFLQLTPQSAAITSMDADHLDIYGTAENIHQSFLDFARCVLPDGKLYVHESLQSEMIKNNISCITYGIDRGQVSAQHVHILNHEYIFDLYYKNTVIRNLSLGIPGKHNVENAVVASAMALDYGISEDALRLGLRNFKGVKRRFEYILKTPTLFIDDYAHHPTELNAIIQSVKAMYPGKNITGIFQPHLFTRTRDFADGFAESLSALDTVILLDIYPARELPIPGVTSQIILEKVTSTNRQILSKEDTLTAIKQNKPDILLTLGAGDIDRLVEPLQQILMEADKDA